MIVSMKSELVKWFDIDLGNFMVVDLSLVLAGGAFLP